MERKKRQAYDCAHLPCQIQKRRQTELLSRNWQASFRVVWGAWMGSWPWKPKGEALQKVFPDGIRTMQRSDVQVKWIRMLLTQTRLNPRCQQKFQPIWRKERLGNWWGGYDANNGHLQGPYHCNSQKYCGRKVKAHDAKAYEDSPVAWRNLLKAV